jgi:hypothetical protein
LDVSIAQTHGSRLGRAPDGLNRCLGEPWVELPRRATRIYDLGLNVLHCDIASIYFEGMYADSDLTRYGYGRDHRPDAKQVNLDVHVTHDEYAPMLCQMLTRNAADITRRGRHTEALQRFVARPELAVGEHLFQNLDL